MDKNVFIILMQILKNYYLNWSFDLNNKILLETWYQFLQHLGEERLKDVIYFYIKRNNNGPNSPRDLMKAHYELELKEMINQGENPQ
jgi:hypothetical protein